MQLSTLLSILGILHGAEVFGKCAIKEARIKIGSQDIKAYPFTARG